jgi:hypothetical protein
LSFGCVKSKRSCPAPAKDLYVSPLLTHERRFAEAAGVPWLILSAEYGLVAPDEWLSPYERYLPETPTGYRSVWGSWVAERLEMLAGPLAQKVIEIHAGSTYADAVTGPLQNKGATLRFPLAGLGWAIGCGGTRTGTGRRTCRSKLTQPQRPLFRPSTRSWQTCSTGTPRSAPHPYWPPTDGRSPCPGCTAGGSTLTGPLT